MNLKGKSLLKLLDFTPDEIAGLLALSAELKAKKKAGVPHDTLRGKNVALIFEKASTRTRCAFEVAAFDLGMHATYLDPTGSQIGKKESISDTAQVLGRMYDGIEYRGYAQSIVEELAKVSGGSVTQTEDILAGVKDADVIYTDVWVSMGEPMEIWEQRIKELSPYQVNATVMAAAKPSAIFMHCLPAFHDLNTTIGKEMGARFSRDSMEVSDDVFSGPQSVVFDEAENRMHTIKAVMLATL